MSGQRPPLQRWRVRPQYERDYWTLEDERRRYERTDWPPTRALEQERAGQPEGRLSNQPLVGSDIDPQFPVFGNPTTASVRTNFLAAKEEIEALQQRIAVLEAMPGIGAINGGTF